MTSYGFWTKTSYDDTTAYRVTEYSNNRLSKKTDSLGVRPTITVASSLIQRGWLFREIAPGTDETNNYKFKYAYKASGYDTAEHTTYKQMQGSTFTSNNLVFASILSGVGGAVVMWQSGSNYTTRNEKYFSAIGHCNDMTYNTQENKLIITGLGGGTDHDNNNLTLYVIDGETSSGSVTKLTPTRPTTGSPAVMSYSGMAYDNDHNYYWARNGMRIYCLDSDFNVIHSFEAPFLEAGQGIEYHKGYIYLPVYEEGEYGANHNSTLQLYFRGVDYNNNGNNYTQTNKIYVYSAKLNADGSPSKEFGKLYLIYYIPRTNSLTGDAGSSKNYGQYGELEGVTFKGDMMYLAFARRSYNSGTFTYAPDGYTYAFYKYDNRTDININYDLVSATYGLTSNKKAVSIHTKDEINDVNGWTTKNVNNLYTEANQNVTINNPTITDNYNNSTTIVVSNPTVTINNLGLDAENMIIKNIPSSTAFSSFKGNFTINNNGIVTSSLSDSANVKTGDTIVIHTMNNDLQYTVSVSGDYNKDGLANKSDAKQIATVILDNTALENPIKYASDYDNNGQIKMNDIMQVLNNID